MCVNTYVCESIFSTMKQVKFENRNRMADETLDDSLRLAATSTGIANVREASITGNPLIDVCNKLLLCNNFNDAPASSVFIL